MEEKLEETTDGVFIYLDFGDFNKLINTTEKMLVEYYLVKHRGVKSRVCEELGMHRQTLYNKMKQHGIKVDYGHDN